MSSFSNFCNCQVACVILGGPLEPTKKTKKLLICYEAQTFAASSGKSLMTKPKLFEVTSVFRKMCYPYHRCIEAQKGVSIVGFNSVLSKAILPSTWKAKGNSFLLLLLLLLLRGTFYFFPVSLHQQMDI